MATILRLFLLAAILLATVPALGGDTLPQLPASPARVVTSPAAVTLLIVGLSSVSASLNLT